MTHVDKNRTGENSEKNERSESAGAQDQELVLEPEDALPEITLAELPRGMQEAVARAAWTKLMPVQRRAMPYLMDRRDLMVQSRTGSGKTGAFVLPILEQINPARASCQALVLVPTRELAQQVANEAALLAGDAGVRVVAVYGGVRYGPQLEAFRQGAGSWEEIAVETGLGKWQLDLRLACRRQLEEAGLAGRHVEVAEECTCCHREMFFSYRRDAGRTGRQIGFIGLPA